MRHRRVMLILQSLRDKSLDRKSTRLNSSHGYISYAVFCLKKEAPGPPAGLWDHLVRHQTFEGAAGEGLYEGQVGISREGVVTFPDGELLTLFFNRVGPPGPSPLPLPLPLPV